MANQTNSGARNTILTKLQRARKPAAKNKNSRPAVSDQVHLGNLDRFKDNLSGNEIQVERIENHAQAIPIIANFLRQNSLPAELRVGSTFTALNWQSHHIHPKDGATTGDDRVCVSQAYAGIEDTGTLVLLSSLENPTLLNFLPDHHIVFLSEQRILSSKADLWKLLKQEQQPIPRAINLISGPSRTADIEQTIQLGAHGPRSLWLFLTTTP